MPIPLADLAPEPDPINSVGLVFLLCLVIAAAAVLVTFLIRRNR